MPVAMEPMQVVEVAAQEEVVVLVPVAAVVQMVAMVEVLRVVKAVLLVEARHEPPACPLGRVLQTLRASSPPILALTLASEVPRAFPEELGSFAGPAKRRLCVAR